MYQLAKLIKDASEIHGEKVAVRFYKNGSFKTISYHHFHATAEFFSEVLKEVLSVFEIASYNYIAVLVDVSDIYPVIIQGILLSGRPFLCFDVDGALKDLINLIEKLEIQIVLTSKDHADKISTNFDRSEKLKEVELFESACQIWKTGVSNGKCNNGENLNDRLLYAIQTSGSTGEKKIVQATENCLLPNLLQLRDLFGLNSSDVVYFGSPITFDPNLIELFLALISGAALCIVAAKARTAQVPLVVDVLFPETENLENYGASRVKNLENDGSTHEKNSENDDKSDVQNDGLSFVKNSENGVRSHAEKSRNGGTWHEENLENEGWCVTFIQTTPSIFLSWPKELTRNRIMKRLKILALGGEECPSLDKLSAYCSAGDLSKIYNLYGITEVSCWASYSNLSAESGRGPMLGVAMSETVLQARDSHGNAVVDGVGEMFIGSSSRICIVGDEIFPEILNSTKKKPLFRATGDIVQVENSGTSFRFLGRKDRIVKRWGHKVNLSLIEEAARQNAYVSNCCCILDDQKGLVMLYQLDEFKKIDEVELRCWLKNDGQLPSNACIPDIFVQLNELPLNGNGKIDRSQLKKLLRETDDPTVGDEIVASELDFRSLWVSCTTGGTLNHHELTNHESNFAVQKVVDFTAGSTLNYNHELTNHEFSSKSCSGFVSSGGTSITALKFISKLLDSHRKVPGELLAKMLSDCTFEECYNLFCGENCVESDETFERIGERDESVEKIGERGKTVGKIGENCGAWKKNVGKIVENGKEREKTKGIIGDYDGEMLKNVGKIVENCKEREKAVENVEENSGGRVETVEKIGESSELIYNREQNLMSADVCEPQTKRRKVAQPMFEESAESDVISLVKCRGNIIRYTSIHDENNELNYSSGEISLVVKWKYFLRKCVDASPTVVVYKNGTSTVSVGSHSGDLVNLDFESGLPKFTCHLPDRIESSLAVSSCAKYGYLGCYDGYLRCIEMQTGEILSSFASSGMIKSTPVLCNNGSIVFGSYDQYLYCLSDKFELNWKWKGSGSFFATPCVDHSNRLLFAATLDGSCLCVRLDDGRLVWQKKLATPVFSSPVLIESNAAVLFAQVSGSVNCLRTVCGSLLWSYNVAGNIFSSPISLNYKNRTLILFGCHDGNVYCLSAGDPPSLFWKSRLSSPVFVTPFVDGQTELVVAAGTSGTISVLRLDDGIELTSLQLDGEVFSSPVLHNGCIVVGCRDNFLYCIRLK